MFFQFSFSFFTIIIKTLFPFQSSQASPIINWLLFLVIHPLSSPSSLAQILGVQVRGKISRTWEKTKPENLWLENNSCNWRLIKCRKWYCCKSIATLMLTFCNILWNCPCGFLV
jgi:hypothetical protein